MWTVEQRPQSGGHQRKTGGNDQQGQSEHAPSLIIEPDDRPTNDLRGSPGAN